jgi:hypothetical protein
MHAAKDIYYIICLDFKFHKLYIVWIDGEVNEDEVLVNDELKIIAFKTEAELLGYWQKYIKEQNREPTTYSIYKLQQWLLNPHPKFDGDEFLNLWNLFVDISESIKLQFIGDIKGDIRDAVYDKLFDTSGLFIVEDPNPVFNADEIDMLSKVMQNGLDLLLNNMVIIENEKVLP